MLDGSPLNEHFDLPTRAVLACLNAREVRGVQIICEDDADIRQHLAFFKCADGEDVLPFALNGEELTQAQAILKSTKSVYEDDGSQDRIKAVEQVLRVMDLSLKRAVEIGVLNQNVPVWHLQPYERDWDVYPDLAA